MSGSSNSNHIDDKRIKIEDTHGKLTSFGATCRKSGVDCFKNICIKSLTKQLDSKRVRSYNTFNDTG